MKRWFERLKDLGGDRSGSVAVEFSFSIIPLAMLMVAIIEFGMIQFTGVLMEGALRDASRYGITGLEEDGTSRLERITELVSDHTLGLVDLESAELNVLVYPGFGKIGSGEEFVDGDGNGVYDEGETFTDENGNGVWDKDIGMAGPGESGEIVVYRIRYDWTLLTPFAGSFIGSDGKFPIRASIAVRNEPWDTSES